MEQADRPDDYLIAFKGSFTSALRWHHLDALWEALRADLEGWYVYAVGHHIPDTPATSVELEHFICEVDELLRKDHDEDYCGIVYADDLKQPSMIKIYDPHNLGVSCGYSDNPPLPGWVLSRLPPVDLESDHLVTNQRKHWWQKIFS